MKALLDTNIIIHRETPNVINQSIGTLFKWLDRTHYTKCVHSITVEELEKNTNEETRRNFKAKVDSYEILKTVAPVKPEVAHISANIDTSVNDKNDTQLLNEIFSGRVDILISEDKKSIPKQSFWVLTIRFSPSILTLKKPSLKIRVLLTTAYWQ